MNCKNNYIFIALLLCFILVIIYFSNFNTKEDFTPGIRSIYNPNKRRLRLYTEQIQKHAINYVNNLQKTFSWS